MTWAIVPAAGRGTRFGGERPKQYMHVAGKPVLVHTLDVLLRHPQIAGVVVALAGGDADWPDAALAVIESATGKQIVACLGGAERADSVLAGLAALPDSVADRDYVLVHDAARPNLHPFDLDALLAQGRHDPVGAILATPVRDTLKQADSEGRIAATIPRDALWRAQTPQLFRRQPLTRALEAARAAGVAVTDEAMAMERLGHRALLVEGREDNLKITTQADLGYFEWLQLDRGTLPLL